MTKKIFSRVAGRGCIFWRATSPRCPLHRQATSSVLSVFGGNEARLCMSKRQNNYIVCFFRLYRCVIMTNIIFSVMRHEEAICFENVIAFFPSSSESVDLDYFFIQSNSFCVWSKICTQVSQNEVDLRELSFYFQLLDADKFTETRIGLF